MTANDATAALVAAERKATATDEPKWRTPEDRMGAILAALDGWRLVPNDGKPTAAQEERFKWAANERANKAEAEIARLRAALGALAHPELVEAPGGFYCPWCGTNVDIHGTTCPVFVARAALAPEAE